MTSFFLKVILYKVKIRSKLKDVTDNHVIIGAQSRSLLFNIQTADVSRSNEQRKNKLPVDFSAEPKQHPPHMLLLNGTCSPSHAHQKSAAKSLHSKVLRKSRQTPTEWFVVNLGNRTTHQNKVSLSPL